MPDSKTPSSNTAPPSASTSTSSPKTPPSKGFSVIKHRWVVERTIAWLMHHRRLVRDYETHPHNSASMITLAVIDNLTKRITGETTITWRDPPKPENSQTT